MKENLNNGVVADASTCSPSLSSKTRKVEFELQEMDTSGIDLATISNKANHFICVQSVDNIDSIDEELMCSVCNSALMDPITHTPCEKTFCTKCVEDVEHCPDCKEGDFKNNCSEGPVRIKNLLGQLKVKCEKCKNFVSRGELHEHEKNCPLNDALKKMEEEFIEKKKSLHEEYQQLSLSLKGEHGQMTLQLQEEHQSLIKDARTEREQLKSLREEQEQLVLHDKQEIEQKEQELKEKVNNFEKQVFVRQVLENGKPIHLNLRGTIMTISLGDVNSEREPNNVLKKMLAGEEPLYQTPSKQFEDPVYFINCSPMVFNLILDWLHFGKCNVDDQSTIESLLDFCSMYQFDNLALKLKEMKEYSPINQHDFFTMLNASSKQICLSFFDMTKLKLRNLNLANSTITYSKFIGMDLSGVNFESADLRGSELNGSNLTGVNFSKCNLSELNLSGFNLKNAKLIQTNISGCNLENATFDKCTIQTHFTKTNHLNGSTFIECSLNGSVFEELEGKLIETILSNSNFKECTFKNIDFSSLEDFTKYQGNKFDSCIFNFEILKEKHIQNIHFANIDFTQLDLSGVTFTNCSSENCKLDNRSLALLSSLIPNHTVYSELFTLTNSTATPKLLYKGSRDGFKSVDFHSKCDNHGATLTIIKSEHNQIFGGFTSQSWQSPQSYGRYLPDSSAFVFKINYENENYQLQKFEMKKDKEQTAVRISGDYLPIFGGGHDFWIKPDCNLNNNSISNFGNTYQLPTGLKYESVEARNYLAGSYKFKVIDIEVFQIMK